MSLDVAAGNNSADSLSFAGLVCIRDQCSKPQSTHFLPPPEKNSIRVKKTDPKFEFHCPMQGSTPDGIDKDSSAGVLFSNGQILPKENYYGGSNKRSRGNVVISHTGSAKKTNTEVRSKANREGNGGASQWFGKKIIQSFATPCRNCRVIEPSPSMKEHTLRQGNT